MSVVPECLTTASLLLRRWRADDAPALAPVLAANVAHLAPWIPARVAAPAEAPELARRLAGFAAAFDEGREWRWALHTPDAATLLGEIGLYPRDAHGRVPYADADRVEIGYWLRADATGRGLATEAARAALDVALALPRVRQVEIRCDARNRASAAVPLRLGFSLAEVVQASGVGAGSAMVDLEVWTRAVAGGTADVDTAAGRARVSG